MSDTEQELNKCTGTISDRMRNENTRIITYVKMCSLFPSFYQVNMK